MDRVNRAGDAIFTLLTSTARRLHIEHARKDWQMAKRTPELNIRAAATVRSVESVTGPPVLDISILPKSLAGSFRMLRPLLCVNSHLFPIVLSSERGNILHR